MSKQRPSSLTRPSSASKPRMVVFSSVKTSPSLQHFESPTKKIQKQLFKSPSTKSQKGIQDNKDFLLQRRDVQLWELTQEIRKLESDHKNVVTSLEQQIDNLPSKESVLKRQMHETQRFMVEISEMKLENENLTKFKIDSQKIIEKLEKQLANQKESYETEIKNLSEVIDLLKNKKSKEDFVQKLSPINNLSFNKSFDLDEEWKKEKERAITFYNALKRKEKECEAFHGTNDDEKLSLLRKTEQLTFENSDLNRALIEAQSDIKRMYLEIKYLNEEMYAKASDHREINKYKQIENDLQNELEEIKHKLKKTIEHKMSSEDELINLKHENTDLEMKLEELGLSLLTMTQELELKNGEYINLQLELEKTKRKFIEKSSKNIEKDKENLVFLVKKISHELTNKFNDIAFQLEKNENKVNNLCIIEKELQGSMHNLLAQKKHQQENEYLRNELDRIIHVNYELKNKLDLENSKRLTDIAAYEDENLKLNATLKKVCKEIDAIDELKLRLVKLEEENSFLQYENQQKVSLSDYDQIESSIKSLNEECSFFRRENLKYQHKIANYEIEIERYQKHQQEYVEKLGYLEKENEKLTIDLETSEMKYLEACSALKEFHSVSFELKRRKDESEQWKILLEDYKEKSSQLAVD